MRAGLSGVTTATCCVTKASEGGGGTARHGTARGGLRCMFLETQSPDSAWDDFHVNLIICLFKSNLTNVLDGANTDRTL